MTGSWYLFFSYWLNGFLKVAYVLKILAKSMQKLEKYLSFKKHLEEEKRKRILWIIWTITLIERSSQNVIRTLFLFRKMRFSIIWRLIIYFIPRLTKTAITKLQNRRIFLKCCFWLLNTFFQSYQITILHHVTPQCLVFFSQWKLQHMRISPLFN